MFSATDVAHFLSCHHLLTLDCAEAAGQIKKPFAPDPGLDLLRELGLRHEQSYLDHLNRKDGRRVVQVPLDIPWLEAVDYTIQSLRDGASAISQATFQNGPWHGRSDFLIRVEKPSALGDWSYEPVETKLARSIKAGALIQLCFYSDLLSIIQEVQPAWMHLVLGRGMNPESLPVAQYIAYFRKVKRDFETAYNASENTYPEPTDHCDVCAWFPVCDKRRHDDDHLCLVAGISRNQRKALTMRAVKTVAALAKLDLSETPKIDGIGKTALLRIRQQASLQTKGREEGHLVYELLEPADSGTGLAALPVPSPGDMFVDFEGDPYAFEQGLEYLIGILMAPEKDKADPHYTRLWSFDQAREKQIFQEFISLVMQRWREYPDLHLYHYAPYEATAIKRLAGKHGVCVDEVDQLLRAGVLVDLYRLMKQGLRASVESYSIKKLEPLYGFARALPLRDSVLALQTFEAALAFGDAHDVDGHLLDRIETYNRDDCLSAWRLREWLEDRRKEFEEKAGKTLSRPALNEAEASEKLAEHIKEVRALMTRLLAPIPVEESERNSEQQAIWLLANLLEYHRREDKSAWWEYYRLCELSEEELLEDKNALAGLVYVCQVEQVKRSLVHRYSFPPQEHAIDRANSVHDPKTKKGVGEVVSINDRDDTIDIKRSISSTVQHPTALIPLDVVDAAPQRETLLRLGYWVADHGISGPGQFQAARDLLLRQAPRRGLGDIGHLLNEHGQLTDVARQLVLSLPSQAAVLPLQGPPGSGKTYTGARMVLELIQNAHRVGITAVSHKVISNLLHEICNAARQGRVRVNAVQKARDGDGCQDSMVMQVDDNAQIRNALNSRSATLAAGTAWLWARSDMSSLVDVLVVDEAGQMSLADVVAISQAATSMILLGDPQQLNQPQRGVHPPGVDVSALAHLLDGRATIDPSLGLFLKETWRLHPAICIFTSEVFYDNRLTSRAENENQRLNAKDFLAGSGLRFIPVQHTGNQSESPEEVEKITALVKDLLVSGSSWTTKTGETLSLKPSDILVVAPYNAQVSILSKALPAGVRVGTVDKFQGQEAPIVFYSMTTSTPEDAPRGMEFLYSLNRLNVATSRARCVAGVVASPALFQVRCKTPRQIQLANALCRYFEMSSL
ncbi:MAG: nuclease [Acidobacteria bacterium]|nr:MAG: nuclease [Acidobacteriota bacterium]